MQWQEVVNILSNNEVYLNNLIMYIEDCLPVKDVLWWSLTDKKELVANLVLQLKYGALSVRVSKLLKLLQMSF